MGKNILFFGLILLLNFGVTFSQESRFLKVGIGYNINRYTNNNNFKAFENYINIRNESENRVSIQELDLIKFHQGIAVNFGLEADKYSFFVEWHNSILNSNARHQTIGTLGDTTPHFEGFKFKMNSISLSGAYGMKNLKIGASLDFSRHKFYYLDDEASKNWLKQNNHFNIGMTSFLEINLTRFIKIKPYIQFNVFRESFKINSLTLPQYEFSANYLSNFGLITFLEIPSKRDN